MSTENGTSNPAQVTEAPKPNENPGSTDPNPTPAPPVKPEPAQEPDWKAEARKWEQRAKENKTAAERLAEIEESQKTEAQKQAEALETANKELAKYKHREQVSKWANEIVDDEKFKGIPAAALKGSTREELEAHAEILKPLITPPTQAASPVPTIGTTPQSGNIPLRDQIAAAEASGSKELVAALKAMQLSNS